MRPTAIFASDIDNTLTDERHLIPDRVITYLESLYQKGWEIIFLTGRTFSFAYRSLEKCPFPYYLIVQNGAETLSMPKKEVLGRLFLEKEVVFALEEITQEMEGDFLVYAGFEEGDFCYYRRKAFSAEMQAYLKKVEEKSALPWKNLNSWSELTQSEFPLIKCMGNPQTLGEIQRKLDKRAAVSSSIIRDTIDPSLHILLITHKEVCKGLMLQKLVKEKRWNVPIITAGDDNNDIELLRAGTLSIAMETGPELLKKGADIIAKPSYKLGIIEALETARERLGL